MTKKVTRRPPVRKDRWAAWRNAPLFALTTIVVVSIDVCLSWHGICAQYEGLVAKAHAAVSVSFSIMVVVLTFASEAMKSDPRTEQQKRAFGAVLCAFALMTVPAKYAADDLALQHQRSLWLEYHGSEAEAADRAIVADPMAESRVKADAAESLKQGIEPRHARFDLGSYLFVGFLLLLNALAAKAGWRALPKTAYQARKRVGTVGKKKPAKAVREPVDMTNVAQLRR